MWMGNALGTIEGDYLSKSIRKAEADLRKLTHREKQKKSGDCNWDPMRRPSNARRKGVCPLKSAPPRDGQLGRQYVPGEPSKQTLESFVCLDKSLV